MGDRFFDEELALALNSPGVIGGITGYTPTNEDIGDVSGIDSAQMNESSTWVSKFGTFFYFSNKNLQLNNEPFVSNAMEHS